MKFTTLPGVLLPVGWSGTTSAAGDRTGRQFTQPLSALVQDTPAIGPDGAMQLSTVWRCVWLIASMIASLPLFVYQTDARGHRELARSTRLFQILHDSPNPRMTPMEFWLAMLLNLLLRGRAYARIVRDESTGEAVALWPMPADQVTTIVLEDGSLVYEYRLDGHVAILAADSVLHLKDLGNGTEGLSKLDHMRASVAESAAAQTAANRLFTNGGKPTGVLMVDQVLKEGQRKAVTERFAEMQAGGFSRLYVLEANMKFQQLSLSPEDQQLLETRQFSVEEICRWFGVPPVLVFHANVTTWGSGVSEIVDGFHKLTGRPIVVNIEQALRKRVLTAAQRARYSVEFSLDALLRANLKDRIEIYAKAVQNGLKTRNECRQLENDAPMTGGDFLTVQSNLLPIGLLGQIKPTNGAPNADQ
jgi:HK97 family phage portal protein